MAMEGVNEPSDFPSRPRISGMPTPWVCGLFWIISEGHKPMPGFRGTMSEEQRWHLVDYVRAFARP
jgi:mono/diheme cytochrome c family protein